MKERKETKKDAKKISYSFPNNLINAPKRSNSPTNKKLKNKNESAAKRAARLSFQLESNIKKIAFTAFATMVGLWAYNKIQERASK